MHYIHNSPTETSTVHLNSISSCVIPQELAQQTAADKYVHTKQVSYTKLRHSPRMPAAGNQSPMQPGPYHIRNKGSMQLVFLRIHTTDNE
jgi:hypothetical protein